MPYKTISFKLLKPTSVKRGMLDDALERYTAAFSLLLRDVRRDLPQKGLTRTEYVRLLDRDRMDLVNPLGVHPFKDSLKLDLSMLLTLWSRGQGGYPVVRTDDEDIRQLLAGESVPSSRQAAAAFCKYGKVRPILFGRHDPGRDYSLLRDSRTGRYYAKLYLWSRRCAREFPGPMQQSLVYLTGGAPPLCPPPRRVRFALFPLEASDWQLRQLREIEAGGAAPKSALLLRRGGEYCLQVRIWYPDTEPVRPRTSLGVVRAIDTPLYYALCDLEGALLEEGPLDVGNVGGKNRIHALSNEILKIAGRHHSRILLENLVGAGDDLDADNSPLSASLYNQVANTLFYKAAFAGLPPCVRVSARRIYQRCPVCGAAKKANRFDRDNLLCVGCGTFLPAVQAAARNLANMLIRYQQTKINVSYTTVQGHVVFRQEDLDFTFTCQDNLFAVESFLNHFRSYLESNPPHLSLRQRSIVKKLRTGDSLQNSLTFTAS